MPDARRIEQVDDQAVRLQGFDDLALVATAGFEGDLTDVGLPQPTGQIVQAALVAADDKAKIARQDMNVELVLADVDAGDLYTLVHLRDPFLACGFLDRAAVRALRRDDAGTLLHFGVQRGLP